MKKFLIAMAAVMMVAASLLVGCGGGGAPASIDGTTWEVTEMSQDGQDMLALMKALGGENGDITMEFKDGKATMTMMGETTDAVDYTYENGKLTMGGDTVEVNGDTITVEMDGAKLVMKKK